MNSFDLKLGLYDSGIHRTSPLFAEPRYVHLVETSLRQMLSFVGCAGQTFSEVETWIGDDLVDDLKPYELISVFFSSPNLEARKVSRCEVCLELLCIFLNIIRTII